MFIQVERVGTGPSVPHGEIKSMQQYMKHTAFHPVVEEARRTAKEAANRLGAAAVFLTLSTGNPADMASVSGEWTGCGENLMILTEDGLKSWLPLLPSKPSSIFSHSQESL